MALPSRGRLLGLALVLVGTAVGAAGFVVVPHPGAAEYEHEVSRTDESTVGNDTSVTPFGRLSPEAQSAFRAAVDGDGRHTAYGQSNRPPEWRYSDNVGYYLVRYQGDLYQVTTWADGFQFFDYVFVSILWVPGLAMVVVGSLRLRGTSIDRPRRSTVAGGALAFPAGCGVVLVFGLGIDWFVVTAGTLILTLGALAALLVRLGVYSLTN